jgi:uracil phosphoribosyltransferase
MFAVMSRHVVIDHPLVQVKLGRLRDQTTSTADFRRLLRETAALLFFMATVDLPTREITVQTPLAPAAAHALERPIVLAPILRAGLGLLEGVFELVPEACVAHIGIYRDETTLRPVSYYARVPPRIEEADVILLDPMLATGHSAAAAVSALREAGAQRLRFLNLVSCPAGIAYFHEEHPDVPIFTAAVDERLDERGYIVPGLGDAGDRFFGT